MSADEDFDEDEEFVEGGPTRVAVVFETIFEARAPLRGALSRVAAHASARGRGRVFPPSPLFRWSASASSASARRRSRAGAAAARCGRSRARRAPTARRCGTQTLFTVHLPLGWADGVEGADSSGSGKPSGVPWV